MSVKRLTETPRTEIQREKKNEKDGTEYSGTEKKKKNILELWGNCERCNIHIMEIPEGEERNRC